MFSLLANSIFAQVAPKPGDGGSAVHETETRFELSRLHQFDDERWLWVGVAGIGVLILLYVLSVYRRDSVDLKPGVGLVLLLLRLATFVGLLVFFLQPTMRTDHRMVRDSRVVVLADVSQSMGLSDSSGADDTSSRPNRSAQVAAALADGPFLDALRAKHEVVVSRFDESLDRIIAFPPISDTDATETNVDESPAEETTPNWSEKLAPRGAETRLGEAIRDVVKRYRTMPLAAVIVLSDGGQNAGIEPDSALQLAAAAKVPIFTIGVGSPEIRCNVRISDFLAPARAYQGDVMTLTAYVQATGYAGRLIDVELSRRDANATDSPFAPLETERIALGTDGEVISVPFELEEDVSGRMTYQVRVNPLTGDTNPDDNAQQADVEVTDRELRVLLFADGATREYRFLRNQLHRDKGIVGDVLLQSSPSGISQDANKILTSFPIAKEELYEYDCIVAFDPDWLALDAQQIAMLEAWVAEEAGGLILIAGPVRSAQWIERAEQRKLLGLLPVLFRRGLSQIGDGRYRSKTPWPLEFTREGEQADFLRLAETPTESRAVWEQFDGMYGYFTVKGPKPNAIVYATTTDPEASTGAGAPVYMAGQFFGSGRVFYMGSGEMWRIRKLSEAYFEVFYTKLIRHVTQGRLLRGTNQGVLLVERDRYRLGDTVVVRAQLKDARHEPLTARSVDMYVRLPDNSVRTEKLAGIADKPGNYSGQFRVYKEGTYSLNVMAGDDVALSMSKRIQVKLPDLERQRPELNETLLSTIARDTGGLYYASLDAAIDGVDSQRPLADRIASREEVEIIRGAPDQDFERQLMGWLLGGICGLLCLEWLIRRVSRLA